MNRPFYLCICLFSILILVSCKKDDEGVQKTAPTVSTNNITGITSSSVLCGGNVSSDGNSAVQTRGVCWSTTSQPTTSSSRTTDGSGTGSFSSSITGLLPSTVYYFRAYAVNEYGTSYGNEVTCTTLAPAVGTVTDIDGNVYNTITIGTQTWMLENLRVLHYRNGDPVTKVTDNTAWNALTTEAYCWQNNDSATNALLYGALYNWYVVNDSRKIAPAGWHIPTDAEWTVLDDYLGGLSVAGGKLKETGTAHWSSPNTGATNSSGFTALPGGYRYSTGIFAVFGYFANFWTSSQVNAYDAWYRYASYNKVELSRFGLNKRAGNSIRCVKD